MSVSTIPPKQLFEEHIIHRMCVDRANIGIKIEESTDAERVDGKKEVLVRVDSVATIMQKIREKVAESGLPDKIVGTGYYLASQIAGIVSQLCEVENVRVAHVNGPKESTWIVLYEEDGQTKFISSYNSPISETVLGAGTTDHSGLFSGRVEATALGSKESYFVNNYGPVEGVSPTVRFYRSSDGQLMMDMVKGDNQQRPNLRVIETADLVKPELPEGVEVIGENQGADAHTIASAFVKLANTAQDSARIVEYRKDADGITIIARMSEPENESDLAKLMAHLKDANTVVKFEIV